MIYDIPAESSMRQLSLILTLLLTTIGELGAAQRLPTTELEGCTPPIYLERLRPATPHADLLRVAELAGHAPTHTNLIERASSPSKGFLCDSELTRPWTHTHSTYELGPLGMRLLPFYSATHYNSAYPRDHNNAGLWAGRGLATELNGGIRIQLGPLSAGVIPTLTYHQNRYFETVEYTGSNRYSELVYPGKPTSIDWPQRLGDESKTEFSLGQSYLRLDLSYLALGISNENLWWGPARRNPLLMSSTAPGFPHLFLGTSKPVYLWVGHLETELIWGRLEESPYFDNDPSNDRNLLAGIVLSFQPRGLPGLYLGGARSFIRGLPPGGLSTSAWLIDPYRGVQDNPLGRDNPESDNQLVSAFARWAPPGTGFEAYFEFGREDHWADLDDLIAEPEVSGGYTIGLQQLFPYRDGWLRLGGELTQLSDPLPTLRRSLVTFYTHSQLRQGYTHRGRILGAPIGPNANSQYLGLDRFTPDGRRGIYLERIRYNVDANSERWVRTYGAAGADIEFTVGLHQHLFLGDFELGWALTHSYRQNRNQIGLRRPEPEVITERNWGLRLDLGWRPQLGRPPSDPYSSTR